MEIKYNLGQTVWVIDKFTNEIRERVISSISITHTGTWYKLNDIVTFFQESEFYTSKEYAIAALCDHVKTRQERMSEDLLKEIAKVRGQYAAEDNCE